MRRDFHVRVGNDEAYRVQQDRRARILRLYAQGLEDAHARLPADEVRLLDGICRAHGVFRATNLEAKDDLSVSVEFVDKYRRY